MKHKSLFIKLFALVAAMMFTLGMQAKEVYVYYTYSDSTLTFYYDNQRSSRTGGLPGYLNEAVSDPYSGENDPDWLYDNFQLGIARVVFDPSFADARPETMFSWFKDMTNLRTIEGWEYLNTSQVTSMNGVFYNCNKLTSIDVSHFNTDAVTFMPFMFYGCTELTSIDLSNFNTDKVTNMEYMFSGCNKLASVKLDSFNTQKVVFMGNMFENCSELTVLNLSSFNTSKLRQTPEMFYGCSKLATIYVSDTWTNNANTYSSYMFYNCTSLVGGQGTAYNVSHIDKTYARIDGGTSNPGYFTDINAVREAYACYTPSNTTLTFYYDNQRSNCTGTTYDLNTGDNVPGWYSDGTYSSVTQVAFDQSFADALPETAYHWFYGMSNLSAISGMEYLNTEQVTNMAGMFYGCSGLTSIDLSSFNTSHLMYMTSMFSSCSGLKSLDLSSFNTAVAIDMRGLFRYCSNLTTIYVGDEWTTANTLLHGFMFTDCTSLVGGMGTTYDAGHVDKTYAHIDGGLSNPGYFSEKVDFVIGDVNGDGVMNITDVTLLINALMSENYSNINTASADMNGDGIINITDVTMLINAVMAM